MITYAFFRYPYCCYFLLCICLPPPSLTRGAPLSPSPVRSHVSCYSLTYLISEFQLFRETAYQSALFLLLPSFYQVLEDLLFIIDNKTLT